MNTIKLFKDLNADEFSLLLNKLNACNEAIEWAKDKTAVEVIEQCNKGEWLLWLFKKINPENLQMLTLAKGHCANTIRNILKDERSIKAIDASIQFGEGKISREELNKAADDAFAAYKTVPYSDYATTAAYKAAHKAADDDVSDAVIYAAAYTIYTADDTAYSAAYTAYTADAATYAAVYAAYASAAVYSTDAKQNNQLLTANICRQYLSFSNIQITL